MKKLYEELELEIVRFETEDVITTSDDSVNIAEETPELTPEGG